MKNSIINKLSAGFGLCIILMLALVVLDFSALNKLGKLYHEALKRSADVELALEAQSVGEDLYLIIANAVINREMTRSEQDWAAGKKANLEKLKKVAMVAETPEEHAKVREAQEAFEEIIRIYEQEMLPLIRKGAVVPGPLADIDVRLDTWIVTIDRSLEWFARSMSDENQKASKQFHDILAITIRRGLAISLIGVVAALSISALTTRRIVGPLAELTRAAREIMNGNYIGEIKHRSVYEIGMLADAFREMSGVVKKRTAELQASNTSLMVEIAERKKVEEEVNRLNAGLEQRVEERTAELVVTNEHLKRVIEANILADEELRISREELRNLSQHLQNVREEERGTIAREIHDELGQLLTALKMEVAWLGGKLPGEHHQLLAKTREMARHIDETIKTVQRISAELRPGILDDLGLTAAIEWQANEFLRKTGVIFNILSTIDRHALDRTLTTTLFRIFQESLTNICRHAHATEVFVTLDVEGANLVMTIKDNGRGINEKKITDPGSLGLIGMRERVLHFGGELNISRIPDGGTCIRVNIPLILLEMEKTGDKNTHS